MNGAARIAVVDDDDSVRESLEGFIRSLGFAADVFASAEEFLKSGPLPECRVLIADLRMPGMGGLELKRRLSENRCQIPVIFITAHANEQTRRRCMRDGAVDFLSKPFSDSALLGAIESALNLK
jgi:FixJ family two-component response regulator